MKSFRPLLIEELPISLPGLRFYRLRLNRHLPEVEQVAEHSHAFGQILLYLSGRGVVCAGGGRLAIVPGSVLWIPPRVRHGFEEQSGRRPLCLVLEFRWDGSCPADLLVAHLPGEGLSQIRRFLSVLANQPEPEAQACRLSSAITVLQMLDVLFPTVGLLPPRHVRSSQLQHRVERILREPGGLELRVAEIAARVGLSKEYLSRSLRQSAGLTLRQLRDRARLAAAIRLLEQGRSVGETAAEVGIPDQNYFARWFRKLTGQRPSRWVAHGTHSAKGKRMR